MNYYRSFLSFLSSSFLYRCEIAWSPCRRWDKINCLLSLSIAKCMWRVIINLVCRGVAGCWAQKHVWYNTLRATFEKFRLHLFSVHVQRGYWRGRRDRGDITKGTDWDPDWIHAVPLFMVFSFLRVISCPPQRMIYPFISLHGKHILNWTHE